MQCTGPAVDNHSHFLSLNLVPPLFPLLTLFSHEPTVGVAHMPEELAAIGLLTFAKKGSTAGSSGLTLGGGSMTPDISPLAAPQLSLVPTGPGLPALPKKLVERICRNEYVDFAELPPAKGKNRVPTHVVEGQIVVLQPGDLTPARRAIPDLATQLQCYGIYTAVLGAHQSHRLGN